MTNISDWVKNEVAPIDRLLHLKLKLQNDALPFVESSDTVLIDPPTGHGLDIEGESLDAIALVIKDAALVFMAQIYPHKSEESRVGKECVSTCRFRWSPDL